MKLVKTAAILAGSVAVLVGATPAFADASPTTSPHMSLNGGVYDALARTRGEEVDPVLDRLAETAGAVKHGNADKLVDGATGLVGNAPLVALK
ncbi:hypothetical protein [Streptomyces niger]|uniref:hypothetical protein n=1 Tax=Streptomyces niger TaxID=66373 RepID=UPI00069B8248|nr:hypothetical protein [Streptomyces niger]